MVIGGVIGGAVDYGLQVAQNFAQGKGAESFTDVDITSIGVSAGAGFFTAGVSSFSGKTAQTLISTTIDVTESVANQATTGDRSITLTQTISDVVSGYVGGALTKNADKVIDTKPLKRDASRTARISANDPSSSGRAARAESARSDLNQAQNLNQIVGTSSSAVAGNLIQEVSDATREGMNSNQSFRDYNIAPADATRVDRTIRILR
jgi:hypothetical protein